jgi:hypothetical protein
MGILIKFLRMFFGEKSPLLGHVWGMYPEGDLYLVPPDAVPPILLQRHDDYPWILKNIPRSATSLVSDVEPIPTSWSTGMENEKKDDIPPPGNWIVLSTPLGEYFAITSPGGWHFRWGPRYDYVDGYYQIFSFTVKRLGGSQGS